MFSCFIEFREISFLFFVYKNGFYKARISEKLKKENLIEM